MEWWSLWLCDRRRTETIFSQSTIHYSNAPRLTQLHRLAAFNRLVDRHQNPDVAQPFFARHFARCVGEDAPGEVVHLGGELIDLGFVDLLAVAAPAPDTFITVSGIETEPALLRVSRVAVQAVDQIRGAAIRQDAAGKFELPDNGFIHFLELHRIGPGFHGRDDDRFLAGEVTRGLQRVNADVHERAAAGQRAPEPPLGRVADAKTETRLDDFDVAEDFLARQAHALEMMRLELAAIPDGQLAAGVPAGGDHLLAFLH